MQLLGALFCCYDLDTHCNATHNFFLSFWLVKVSACESVLTVEAAKSKLLKIAAISQNKLEGLLLDLELYLKLKIQHIPV